MMTSQYNILDLSVPIEKNDGEISPFKLRTISHEKGAKVFYRNLILRKKSSWVKKIYNLLLYFWGVRKINSSTFPSNKFLNLEILTLSTHTGTHMDAPFHFGPCSQDQKAMTIEQLPLSWCFSDGVLLDLSKYTSEDDGISLSNVLSVLKEINYQIKAFDIVLFKTGASEMWGSKNYFTKYPYLQPDVIEFFLNKQVKIIGIDTYSFDAPFQLMIDKYFKTKNKSVLWPNHFIGRSLPYFHIERLCNLDKIPSATGFKVCCFPIKIANSGASWVRTVAFLPSNN